MQKEESLRRYVWRDDDARRRLDAWFDRFQSRIEGNVESREVRSRFGRGHVLLAGPSNGKPVVCLHAMRTGSAFLVSELNPLLDRCRIIAPDLPGQSVRGPQVRLSVADQSYADWLFDVLDELGLGTVKLFGVSWGGFVARLAATRSPDRIERLAMLVPAGIVNGSHLTGLMKMAIPMIRYRVRRSRKNLQRLIDPLFTTWDDDWASYTGDAIRDMPFDFRIPPLASDQELRGLSMPTLVLGAAEDISFPGHALVDRVCSQIPQVEGEVIPDCKHCPPTNPEFRKWLANRLTMFLTTAPST